MTYKTHILYQKGDFKKVALLDGRTVRTKYGVLYPCRGFSWRLLSASPLVSFLFVSLFKLRCASGARPLRRRRRHNAAASSRRPRSVAAAPILAVVLRTRAADFITPIAALAAQGVRPPPAAPAAARRSFAQINYTNTAVKGQEEHLFC